MHRRPSRQQLLELERISGGVAERGVVEDDPALGAGACADLLGELVEEAGLVSRVVGARRAVKTPVAEAGPSSRGRGGGGGFRGIGCYARDVEAAQETVRGRREPCGIARLERDEVRVRAVRVKLANRCEELVRQAFVVLQFGWELHEERAELVTERANLLEEIVQELSAVRELRGVGDGLGELHGKAEIRRRAGGPALPCFALMGAVEAGVDLDAVEAVRAALEVRALGRKVMSVRARQSPTGGADAENLTGWMSARRSLLHLCLDAS